MCARSARLRVEASLKILGLNGLHDVNTGGLCQAGSLDERSASPAAQACDLGTRMLLELFCAHKEFRRDIISMCHNRLIGAKVGWLLVRWRET